MKQAEDLFTEAFLRQLEQLSLVSRKFSSGAYRGDRRSRRRGAGLEFAEHRPYLPGDDFRYLDWMAYQRFGRLFLRQFEEEQNLPVSLFLDVSLSMSLGSPSKFDFARLVAAALAYVALTNLDQVDLYAFNRQVVAELRHQRGKDRMAGVLDFLRELTPQGETGTLTALEGVLAGSKRRGVVVVLSDWLDEGGFEEGLRLLLRRRQEVFVLHFWSREEEEPPWRGECELVDVENGSRRRLHLSGALLEAYGREFQRFTRELQQFCRHHGLGYLSARTDESVEQVILEVFRKGWFLR